MGFNSIKHLGSALGFNSGKFGSFLSGGPTAGKVLADGNTVLWVDSSQNVTKNGANKVSVWGDKSGQGNDLLQATGASQPLWSTNGILFDGANDFMKAAAFTLVQPEMIYIVFKQVAWTLSDRIFDGNTDTSMLIAQSPTSSSLVMHGGAALTNANLPLNTFGIARLLFNGANSKFTIDNTTPVTGNAGSISAGGFTLGARGTGTGFFSNVEVKEIIIRKVADSAEDETLIYQYLSDKYLPTVEEVLADGSTMLWVDSEENVTKNGANKVSVWGDKSGEGNDLLQATGAAQPLWSTNGIRFDGVNDFLKAAAFTLVQPEMIYIVFKQVTWANVKRIFDGNTATSGMITQRTSSPIINAWAGGLSGDSSDLAINSYGIVRCLFNGANSKLIIDETTPITGNFGTNNMGGFSIGSDGGGSNNSNVEVKEIIVRKVADSATDEALIYQYLSDKYLPTAEDVLADGSTMLWVDSEENVTKNGSNKVSVWGDKSGQGNDLLQATGSAQPLWSTNGILFDGANDFLKAAAFTLVQPEMIYIVFKQVTWSFATRVFDGDSTNSMVLSQYETTPSLNMQVSGYSSSLSVKNTNLPVNTFGIARCLYDGVNSKFIIDNTTPVTGSVSTLSAGGFTLGARGSNALHSNIEVKEIIIRKVADSATDEALIYQYLSNKYGI